MAFFNAQGLESKIESCESIIGYSFVNTRLILEALNMSGEQICFQKKWTTIPKNTRLAVYGDAAADLNLCSRWIRTTHGKAQWTQVRTEVLGNQNLSRVGRMHGLDACVNTNPGTTAVSDAMMATTIEAILGAVHLDGGDEALSAVMATMCLTHNLTDSLMVRLKPLPLICNLSRVYMSTLRASV